MSANTERERFEAWLNRRRGPTGDEPGYPGPRPMYPDERECAWEGWKAALSSLPIPPEPDCWAILTPNGSKLVSPDEAKGRKGAYPLYAAPPPPQVVVQPTAEAETDVRILTIALDRAYRLPDSIASTHVLDPEKVPELRKMLPKRFVNSFEYKAAKP